MLSDETRKDSKRHKSRDRTVKAGLGAEKKNVGSRSTGGHRAGVVDSLASGRIRPSVLAWTFHGTVVSVHTRAQKSRTTGGAIGGRALDKTRDCHRVAFLGMSNSVFTTTDKSPVRGGGTHRRHSVFRLSLSLSFFARTLFIGDHSKTAPTRHTPPLWRCTPFVRFIR